MAPIDLITTPSEYQRKLEEEKREECFSNHVAGASPTMELVGKPATVKVTPIDEFTQGKSYTHDIPELTRAKCKKWVPGQATHEEKKDYALIHLMKLYELIQFSSQMVHVHNKGVEEYFDSYKKEILLQIKRYIKECL